MACQCPYHLRYCPINISSILSPLDCSQESSDKIPPPQPYEQSVILSILIRRLLSLIWYFSKKKKYFSLLSLLRQSARVLHERFFDFFYFFFFDYIKCCWIWAVLRGNYSGQHPPLYKILKSRELFPLKRVTVGLDHGKRWLMSDLKSTCVKYELTAERLNLTNCKLCINNEDQ